MLNNCANGLPEYDGPLRRAVDCRRKCGWLVQRHHTVLSMGIIKHLLLSAGQPKFAGLSSQSKNMRSGAIRGAALVLQAAHSSETCGC